MTSFIGAATVITCFFMLGKRYTERDKNLIENLSTVIRLFSHIKSNICSNLLPLPEIYKSFEGICGNKSFCTSLASKGADKAIQELILPKQAYAFTDEVLLTLGRLDKAAQTEALEKAVSALEAILNENKKEYEKKSKSVPALCVLTGMLTVILLL